MIIIIIVNVFVRVLVANKIDLVEQRLVTTGIWHVKCGARCKFRFACSCLRVRAYVSRTSLCVCVSLVVSVFVGVSHVCICVDACVQDIHSLGIN